MRPEGWHSLTARIVARDAAGLVAFLRNVFGATGELLPDRPAVLRIGDSNLMISEAGERDAATAFLYVYVDDCDATYARAITAGARPVEQPFDTPYGDRRAMVEDRWGNRWQIARYAKLS